LTEPDLSALRKPPLAIGRFVKSPVARLGENRCRGRQTTLSASK
jgi:hypothetical protein